MQILSGILADTFAPVSVGRLPVGLGVLVVFVGPWGVAL